MKEKIIVWLKRRKSAVIFTIFVLSVIAVSFSMIPSKVEEHKIPYTEFIQKVESGEIAAVTYEETNPKLIGTLKPDDKPFFTDNPQSKDFKKYLLEKGVQVKAETSSSFSKTFWSIFQLALTMAIIAVMLSFMIDRFYKKHGSTTELKIELIKKSNITFDNVAGNEEAKDDMAELVDFLKNPVKFERYGATPPKGTILYGPPGTGKTLLAKALAGTAEVPFIAISGSDFVEKYVGVGAARVRQLFEKAKKNSPCIIFIDEIDAVGKKRGDGISGNDERDQTLNQILAEMDGFSTGENIIVIAATNRLDTLDKALLRSGRFDRHVRVELPDVEARCGILAIHAEGKPLAEDVDLREVAKMTIGMSGADLSNVLNEASIYAARSNGKGISMRDVDRAINKIVAGEEKKNRRGISEKDRRITATHEAGHALVAKLVSKKSIPKVTIIPTTKGAGGYTLITPEEKMFETKKEMKEDIAILLGGRIAEELVFGKNEITGGASQDLRQVTAIAMRMVKNYGMNDRVGLVNVEDLYGDTALSSTNEAIAEEVRLLVDGIYQESKELLHIHKKTLTEIASLLLEKETIYEQELDALLQKNIKIERVYNQVV